MITIPISLSELLQNAAGTEQHQTLHFHSIILTSFFVSVLSLGGSLPLLESSQSRLTDTSGEETREMTCHKDHI